MTTCEDCETPLHRQEYGRRVEADGASHDHVRCRAVLRDRLAVALLSERTTREWAEKVREWAEKLVVERGRRSLASATRAEAMEVERDEQKERADRAEAEVARLRRAAAETEAVARAVALTEHEESVDAASRHGGPLVPSLRTRLAQAESRLALAEAKLEQLRRAEDLGAGRVEGRGRSVRCADKGDARRACESRWVMEREEITDEHIAMVRELCNKWNDERPSPASSVAHVLNALCDDRDALRTRLTAAETELNTAIAMLQMVVTDGTTTPLAVHDRVEDFLRGGGR